MTEPPPELTPDSLSREIDRLIPPGVKTPAPLSGRPSLRAAANLANDRPPTLLPEMKTRIESRVRAAADAMRLPRPRVARRRRLTLAASLLLVVVFLMILVAGAVRSAPGDPLYSAKQRLEIYEIAADIILLRPVDGHLRIARRRVDELTHLLDNNTFDLEPIENARFHLSVAADMAGADRDRVVEETQQILDDLSALLTQARQRRFISLNEFVDQAQIIENDVNSGAVLVAPTPTPTPTLTPTLTLPPSLTPTPTATNTPTATATPTATSTSTFTPTAAKGDG